MFDPLWEPIANGAHVKHVKSNYSLIQISTYRAEGKLNIYGLVRSFVELKVTHTAFQTSIDTIQYKLAIIYVIRTLAQ